MIFNKYSESTDGSGTVGAFSSSSSSSSSGDSNVGTRTPMDIDRILWGNPDTGGDIESHLVSEGNIIVCSMDYSGEDGETDEDDDYTEDDGDGVNEAYERRKSVFDGDDEGGNLYVEKRIISDKTVETKEVIADKHIVRGGTKNQIMLADGSLCNKGRFTIDYIDMVDIEGTIALQGDEGVSVTLQDYPTAPKFKFRAVPATTDSVGGIKVGSGLTIEKDGTLSVNLESLDEILDRLSKLEKSVSNIMGGIEDIESIIAELSNNYIELKLKVDDIDTRLTNLENN